MSARWRAATNAVKAGRGCRYPTLRSSTATNIPSVGAASAAPDGVSAPDALEAAHVDAAAALVEDEEAREVAVAARRFEELRARLLQLETSVVADADKVNSADHKTGLASLSVLDPAIYPLNPDLKMCGVARTVRTRGNEFLTVLDALCNADEGEVLMVDGGGTSRALSGEIFATQALQKGLGGIVIDGACRDSALIRRMPLPYYTRGVHPAAGSTADPCAPFRLNRLFLQADRERWGAGTARRSAR